EQVAAVPRLALCVPRHNHRCSSTWANPQGRRQRMEPFTSELLKEDASSWSFRSRTRWPSPPRGRPGPPESGVSSLHSTAVGARVQPASAGLHPQRIEVDTPGHFGGRPGQRAAIRLEEDASIRGQHELGALDELRRPSQVLTIELAGGSGYGSPAD